MTFIGLCGLNASGKGTVVNFLVENNSFTEVALLNDANSNIEISKQKIKTFPSLEELTFHVTSNWRDNFVIRNLPPFSEIAKSLLKRPFFILVHVHSPALERLKRITPKVGPLELMEMDDCIMYDNEYGLSTMISSSKATMENNGTIKELNEKLSKLDLSNESVWIRPSWDRYFMSIADLASKRSNCMKRRVGALVVMDKRIISTGYNGTAKGLLNCNEGGCPRCNSNTSCGKSLDSCLCLHAEENSLLEAGRARCIGATLYCTTAPCLGCSQMIIQCGITRVVYNEEYSIHHNTKELLSALSIQLERLQL